jgi:hypothetical protein
MSGLYRNQMPLSEYCLPVINTAGILISSRSVAADELHFSSDRRACLPAVLVLPLHRLLPGKCDDIRPRRFDRFLFSPQSGVLVGLEHVL